MKIKNQFVALMITFAIVSSISIQCSASLEDLLNAKAIEMFGNQSSSDVSADTSSNVSFCVNSCDPYDFDKWVGKPLEEFINNSGIDNLEKSIEEYSGGAVFQYEMADLKLPYMDIVEAGRTSIEVASVLRKPNEYAPYCEVSNPVANYLYYFVDLEGYSIREQNIILEYAIDELELLHKSPDEIQIKEYWGGEVHGGRDITEHAFYTYASEMEGNEDQLVDMVWDCGSYSIMITYLQDEIQLLYELKDF